MNILSLIVLPLMIIPSTSGQENLWYMLCILSNCFQTPPQQTSYQQGFQPISTQQQPYTTQQIAANEQQQVDGVLQTPDNTQQQTTNPQFDNLVQTQPESTTTPPLDSLFQAQVDNLLQTPDSTQQQLTNPQFEGLLQTPDITQQLTNSQVDNLLQTPGSTQQQPTNPQFEGLLQTPDNTQQLTNPQFEGLLQTQPETTNAPPLDSLFETPDNPQPDTTNTQFDNLLQQQDTMQQLNQQSVNTDVNSISNAGLIFTGSEVLSPQSNTGVIGSPALERPPPTNDVDASKSLTEIPVTSSQTNNEIPNQAQANSETSMSSSQPEFRTPIQTNVMTSDSVRTFSLQPQQPQYQHSWTDDIQCYFVNGQCQDSYQLCFGILKESFCAGATSSCCIPLNEFMPQ